MGRKPNVKHVLDDDEAPEGAIKPEAMPGTPVFDAKTGESVSPNEADKGKFEEKVKKTGRGKSSLTDDQAITSYVSRMAVDHAATEAMKESEAYKGLDEDKHGKAAAYAVRSTPDGLQYLVVVTTSGHKLVRKLK